MKPINWFLLHEHFQVLHRCKRSTCLEKPGKGCFSEDISRPWMFHSPLGHLVPITQTRFIGQFGSEIFKFLQEKERIFLVKTHPFLLVSSQSAPEIDLGWKSAVCALWPGYFHCQYRQKPFNLPERKTLVLLSSNAIFLSHFFFWLFGGRV